VPLIILRNLALYSVYAAVVGALLLQLVGSSRERAEALETPPSARVDVSLSVIDGSPEHSILCTTMAARVTTDAIAVHSQADLETLLQDLGCASSSNRN
jgi:hypothetical protein